MQTSPYTQNTRRVVSLILPHLQIVYNKIYYLCCVESVPVVVDPDVLELGEVVPVPDELEFLLPLQAAKQTANAATVITDFTFFIN